MKSISVSKFKATCLGLLDKLAKTGKPILITKNGKPLAQIILPPKGAPQKSWLGSAKGILVVSGDTVSPAAEATDWEALKE